MLQVSGRRTVQQDDRSALAAPGQLVAWQSSRPFAVEGLEPFEALMLVCPARLLPQAVGLRTAESLESTTSVGRIARDYVTDLFASAVDATLGARARSPSWRAAPSS